ncbi:nuclear transport factor 2 family protein [Kitasatospora sp. NPDC048365]|uniref:SnoaL-like domain-containing protein n=1 Tax=Kitasatospora terrestris TaxID=258051 RepID=A0ABP9DQ38_9ACTN
MTDQLTRRAAQAAAAMLSVAVLCTACAATTDSGADRRPAAAEISATGTTDAVVAAAEALPASTGTPGAGDLGVARGYTDAANRGDVAGITAAFAPNAHFDRAGSQFTGRDAIVNTFIRPDVVDDKGHYREISVTTKGDRTVIEYVFTARGGGVTEHFTYAYLIKDGVIVDVIGRYV